VAQLEAREIPAAHGHLEALLRLPDAVADPPAMAAVVCHPHPQFGGTLHTKTVFRIAQALVDLGVPTLRFNFRGVGRSTGATTHRTPYPPSRGAGTWEQEHGNLSGLFHR
jgi:alpha/beta superfamily hydrolase